MKIRELERRRDADESNKDIEAALNMANNTKKLMYDGNQWLAVVNVPSMKTEVTVACEEDWVKQRFHAKFLSFMRIYGRVGGYTQLDSAMQYDSNTSSQMECQVIALEYKYFFGGERPSDKFILHYKNVSESQQVQSH